MCISVCMNAITRMHTFRGCGVESHSEPAQTTLEASTPRPTRVKGPHMVAKGHTGVKGRKEAKLPHAGK